jgi:hypothetical protein
LQSSGAADAGMPTSTKPVTSDVTTIAARRRPFGSSR